MTRRSGNPVPQPPQRTILLQQMEVMIGGCESNYFVGEQIELTVTFTNTFIHPSSSNSTAPASPNPPRSAASHRRGTHSTSSPPLSSLSTSPGVHQVFHTHHRPSLSVSSDPPRTRRGFIGFRSVPLQPLSILRSHIHNDWPAAVPAVSVYHRPS